MKIRTGVSPRDIPAFVTSRRESLNNIPILLDFASGFVYTTSKFEHRTEAVAWIRLQRQESIRLGGYSVVLEMPAGWNDSIEPFGYQPDILALMKKLKKRWDPAGILNPGGFIANAE